MTDSAVDDHVVSGVVAGLFPRNAANDVLATRVLTNPCRSSILNLGCTPTRVVASKRAANVGISVQFIGPRAGSARVRPESFNCGEALFP